MPKVTETIEIAASQAKVFELIADPARAPVFVPGLNRISAISPGAAKVGRTWEWEFNWFGFILSGKTQCSKYEAPSTYQFQTMTGAKSTWTYTCKGSGNNTMLTLDIDFEAPAGLLAKFAMKGALEKMNQNRVRETTANIKALLES